MPDKKAPILLFESKSECCGCGACMNKCPRQAISMYEDENGFIYPEIAGKKCVRCGTCKRICAYQNTTEELFPQMAYAGYHKDKKVIMKSASGGVYAALAQSVLETGGIIVGAAYSFDGTNLTVNHRIGQNIDDLKQLQGSKYVQSNMGHIYKDIKQLVVSGKTVLFSGTPCQVDAVKRFLEKSYENFYTMDIICHGVPSQKTWHKYVEWLSEKVNSTIDGFNFRDKNAAWENFEITFQWIDRSGNRRSKNIHCRESAFYEDFLKANIYRENCYSCKYAQNKRVGDITIGDYWGVRNVHPEWMQLKNWVDVSKHGISCVLVNSTMGKRLIDTYGDRFFRMDTTPEKVFKFNGQLNFASERPENRELILSSYMNSYKDVQAKFDKNLGKKKYIYRIKNIIPYGVKEEIKKIKTH